MASYTPQFDKVLKKYFEELKLDEKGGQWRKCRFSGKDFYVRPEDIVFYRKIGVLLPTLSPHERARRRLAFLGYVDLFKIKSALTGKQIIAQYPPNTPYKIYEHQTWFGEGWDPMAFGRTYDPRLGFLEQYREFNLNVPRPNLFVSNSVNTDFGNIIRNVKNGYLVFDAFEVEDSAYCLGIAYSRNCFDCFVAINNDTCYESFVSDDTYHSFFIEYSKNCLDSYFLFDCRNCSNCFACTNLRHKKYYFFNQPLSKDEYGQKLKNINLGNRLVLEEYKKKFKELKKKAFYRENHNERSINVVGDYIKNSKNCYSCFYTAKSENVAYYIGGKNIRDSYDATGGINCEQVYEIAGGGENNFNLKFCTLCNNSIDLEYCDLCDNCRNCFGCIGLKNKSFCVFNKQYKEDDYWKIVNEIKVRMLEDKEYGEFFPPDFSPFPFNISAAVSYKGYDDIEEAKKYGYNIEPIPETVQEVSGEIIEAENLPEDILDVSDDILKKIIYDKKNGKKFFYTKNELNFYRTNNLPLPQEHYTARLAEKRHRFGTIALELYDRTCAKCGKKIESSYAPDRPETVYCQKCYQNEVV